MNLSRLGSTWLNKEGVVDMVKSNLNVRLLEALESSCRSSLGQHVTNEDVQGSWS